MSKLTKLCTLNMWGSLYINYTSIELVLKGISLQRDTYFIKERKH